MGAFKEHHSGQRLRRALLVSILSALMTTQTHTALSQGARGASHDDAPARLAALTRRLRATPADAEALKEARDFGFELLRAGSFAEAALVFEMIREAAPTDQPALYGGALALFNLRRYDEAEILARTAADDGAHAAKGAGRRSIEAARQDAGIAAGVSDALVLLGVILAVKKDDAGALAAVRRAVALAPSSFDAQFALGRALYGAGDPAGAALAFRAASALRPGEAQVRFFLATALERAGDDAGALAAYRELTETNPSFAEGHLGAGVLLAKRGGAALAEGIAKLERALALDDDLYEGRVGLGRALIRAGRVSEAVEHLKRAAELAPQNPEPHYQLAVAYRRLGRKAEAERESAIVRRLHEEHRGPVSKTGEGAAAKPNP